MAIANVTLICEKCGKTFFREKICYNRKEADQYEEWARKNIVICSECRCAEKRETAKKATEEAMKEVEEIFQGLEFAPLTGSPKQILWAETLRRTAVAKVHKKRAPIDVLNFMCTITESWWWIDNRKNIDSDIDWFIFNLRKYYRENCGNPVEAADVYFTKTANRLGFK